MQKYNFCKPKHHLQCYFLLTTHKSCIYTSLNMHFCHCFYRQKRDNSLSDTTKQATISLSFLTSLSHGEGVVVLDYHAS